MNREETNAIAHGSPLPRHAAYGSVLRGSADQAKSDSRVLTGTYLRDYLRIRKNVIITYDRLRQLTGFKDYEAFASVHRKWVHDLLGNNEDKRDSRWSESIAVGSIQFTKRIKTAMGAMAKGRTIRGIKDGFELRESLLGYNAVLDTENCNIAPKKVLPQNVVGSNSFNRLYQVQV